MSQDQIDYKAVRRRVEEGVKKRKASARIVFFVVSLCMLIVFSLMGWGMAAVDGGLENGMVIGGMTMLTVAGAMSVMFQFISLFFETKSGEASIRQRLITQELGEEMLRMGLEDDVQQKSKRAMRLAEDGELEEIVDENAPDITLDEDQQHQSRSG